MLDSGVGQIPNDWKPREYQQDAWHAWIRDDVKHVELMAHRRWGKDDLALHGTAVKALDRVANYWHMLPLQVQVRKAIWTAVNPATGKRRIDEAFPLWMRTNTQEQEMMIRLINGSTWQCLGSDGYQNAIGSSPAGIVFSEWSQSNPNSRGYLRPILLENDGWQVYITTPRGKNHAYKSYNSAKKNPNAFAQLQTVEDTGRFTPEQLKSELQEYIDLHGDDMGRALFEQEYFCSFDAAIPGAYYGAEFRKLEARGGIRKVPHDPDYPVSVAMDIGYSDDTSIWWYQVVAGEVRVIEFYTTNGKDPAWFASIILGREVFIDLVRGELKIAFGKTIDEGLAEKYGGKSLAHRREYVYKTVWIPHDAKAKTFAAHGKSVQEQFSYVFGWAAVKVVPGLSFNDGIKAVRSMFPRVWFDEGIETTNELTNGIEGLRQYQREWDEDKRMFKDNHLHNWCSHPADAFRYLAIVWQEDKPKPEDKPMRFPVQGSFDEMRAIVRKRRQTGND